MTLYTVLILSLFLVVSIQSMEPLIFQYNNTSGMENRHNPSQGWTEKYLRKDIVVVRIPQEHDTSQSHVDKLAQDHGFTNEGPMGKIPHYYTWTREKTYKNERGMTQQVDNEIPIQDLFNRLEKSPHVEWWNAMIPRERIKRVIAPYWSNPTDPLYSRQWHLQDTHLNVINAWKDNHVTGKNVNLAIVDDGIQRENPDLSRNYKRELSWDFNDDDSDPEPFRQDGHGTSASGLAGACKDTHCGVGVAFDVNLVGLRLLGAWTSDSDEARALCHLCDEEKENGTVHIYSNSWGPSDEGQTLGGPGHLVSQAFSYCTQNGRNGKGSIYVWAGGNGRDNGDDSNYDGYANSIYTISVAAVSYNDHYAWYSEPGANLLCSAPSSGLPRKGIVTTDLMSTWGYSPNGCTDSFGGTSASAPQIAGVVALLLEANTQLSWIDVQNIFVKTSRVIDTHDIDWTVNAAGFEHSHDYGFGMVDANEAVKAAISWPVSTTSIMKSFSTGDITPGRTNVHAISSTAKNFFWNAPIWSSSLNSMNRLNHVSVHVDMDTPQNRKCLRMELFGPSGVSSLLHSDSCIHGEEKSVVWTFDTVRHWGEHIVYNKDDDVRGNMHDGNDTPVNRWTLRVRDTCSSSDSSNKHAKVGHITLNTWAITFYGE